MGKLGWTERAWSFDDPVGKAPELLERLRGTCARLRERTAGVSRAMLTTRIEEDGKETWSIQENAGHLWDLLALEARRLEQFIAGDVELSAADMTNAATWSADHNAREIGEILDGFERERLAFVERVSAMEPSMLARSALHPRLRQPMRLVDMLRFFSEHDDYHLARITWLRERLGV